MKKNDLGRECRTRGRDCRYVLGFGEEPEGMRPLVRHSCICENNIKMDILEIG